MSEVREAIASATRIVVKVGSSSLTSEVGGVDEERLSTIVANVASRCARGTEVVLVSSGAIATGFPTLGLARRPQIRRPSKHRRASVECWRTRASSPSMA